ncbi:MAG: D-glycerate dehydrogenase [Herpetosiphon sp.]
MKQSQATRPGTANVFVVRSIPDAGLRLVQEACDTDVWPGQVPASREQLLSAVRGCDGILALLTDRIDGEVMDAAGAQLKVISNFAVGVDNIDIPAATRRGIPVGNTPGVLTETTADLAWALLLAAARHVVAGDRYVRAGSWRTWEPQLLLGPDVYGATLGIVGWGRIGRAVARRAAGFQMRVLAVSRNQATDEGAEFVSLDTLLRQSDFVSIHTPLTTETHHLFNRDAFERMKVGAVLVNTARGPLVDSHALYESLASGHLAAAALDVTEPEPIGQDDPLLTLPNCIIVPHIGSASIATRDRMATMAARNVLAGVEGRRLPHCVNPEVYDKNGSV